MVYNKVSKSFVRSLCGNVVVFEKLLVTVRNLLVTVNTRYYHGITLVLSYLFMQKQILLHVSLCGLYLCTKLKYYNKYEIKLLQ